MRGGFESSISAMPVIQVFESSHLAIPRYASIYEYIRVFEYLKYFFLKLDHAYSPIRYQIHYLLSGHNRLPQKPIITAAPVTSQNRWFLRTDAGSL